MNCYVLMADYGGEGQDAVRVYMDKEQAIDAMSAASVYQTTRPNAMNGPVNLPAWKAEHPEPQHSGCRSFFVTEVPLVED